MRFMSNESFDIVMNHPRGSGLEASRPRCYDPAAGGQGQIPQRLLLRSGRYAMDAQS